MKFSMQDVSILANRAMSKQANFANEALSTRNAQQETEVMIADSMGFHIYGDLHLTLELSAATDQKKANLFLEVLEDLADIASEFTRVRNNLFIFEVQGERVHFFLDFKVLDEQAMAQLLDFASYFTRAVYEKIKPKIEDYWAGFCMAADFGRAIVVSTGQEGDDSLVSLGRPANEPAKRLSRAPQIKSGHLALKAEVAEKSGEIRNVKGRFSSGDWIEVNVKDRPLLTQKDAALAYNFSNAELDEARSLHNRGVALSVKAAEVVDTGRATVKQPTFVRAFILRADLDGFTARVELAFAENNPEAIKRLVAEFLQIMKIPKAFEDHLGRPLIRLPWAGDCYNALFLPKDYETYESIRSYLPVVLALNWFDPEGVVNNTRDQELAKVASRCDWSIGVAGGAESQGRLLVANIKTYHRHFLVVAGWGASRSLDAQNAKGLRKAEAAIHDEDFAALDGTYKDAFNKWDNGPVEYRKATAAGLQRTEREKLQKKQVYVPPCRSSIVVPAARDFYET